MKIKTSKVSLIFNIHPAHFLQHLIELDASLTFDDVWPEVEESWVDTFSVSSGHVKKDKGVVRSEPKKIICDVEQGLSADAIHVLDKLCRQGKWGKLTISLEALVKITHLSMHIIQNVVVELNKKGYLDQNGIGKGVVSLNPARSNEIEVIVQKNS